MSLRPNRVKRKLAAGEIACLAVGPTHPDDIDAFRQNAQAKLGYDPFVSEAEQGMVRMWKAHCPGDFSLS